MFEKRPEPSAAVEGGSKAPIYKRYLDSISSITSLINKRYPSLDYIPLINNISLLYTLQGINISHLGKRKIIFKMPFLGGYVSSQEGTTCHIWKGILDFPWTKHQPQRNTLSSPSHLQRQAASCVQRRQVVGRVPVT